jgi:hypothetical protein
MNVKWVTSVGGAGGNPPFVLFLLTLYYVVYYELEKTSC